MPRCLWFWLWSAAGALLAFSLLSFIGVFTGLPAVVALALVARHTPRWPEPLGLPAGVGALCLFVGTVALVETGGPGTDPLPWLVGGAALVLLGLFGYGVALRSSSP